MAKTVVLDELRIVVRVPVDMSAAAAAAARRALARAALAKAVGGAVRAVFVAAPGLAKCRVSVAR